MKRVFHCCTAIAAGTAAVHSISTLSCVQDCMLPLEAVPHNQFLDSAEKLPNQTLPKTESHYVTPHLLGKFLKEISPLMPIPSAACSNSVFKTQNQKTSTIDAESFNTESFSSMALLLLSGSDDESRSVLEFIKSCSIHTEYHSSLIQAQMIPALISRFGHTADMACAETAAIVLSDLAMIPGQLSDAQAKSIAQALVGKFGSIEAKAAAKLLAAISQFDSARIELLQSHPSLIQTLVEWTGQSSSILRINSFASLRPFARADHPSPELIGEQSVLSILNGLADPDVEVQKAAVSFAAALSRSQKGLEALANSGEDMVESLRDSSLHLREALFACGASQALMRMAMLPTSRQAEMACTVCAMSTRQLQGAPLGIKLCTLRSLQNAQDDVWSKCYDVKVTKALQQELERVHKSTRDERLKTSSKVILERMLNQGE